MSNYINWMIDNKTRFWQSIALGMALLLLAMSIVALGSSVVAKLSNDNKPVAAPPSVPVTHVAPPAPPAPKPELVYDPPCGPDSNAHVCTEQITKKSRVQGRIHTVIYDSNATDPANFDHIVPDYTEVEYDPCDGDDCAYAQVKFCGNVLDKFDPGKTINMIVKDSNLTGYNACYIIDVVELTNGGKPISKWAPRSRSTVPGAQ